MKSRGRKAARVVKHRLADGTVKEYKYPPHKPKTAPASAESIRALITAYQRSPEWLSLAASTRQNYSIYFRPLDRVGHVRAADVRRRDLMIVRDAIAAERGPGAATGFIRAASALFSWAVSREWIDNSPATRIKALAGGTLRAWTPAQAATAIHGLPEPLRRAVVLALYTGQRRGDLVTLPWSAYDGMTIRLTQQKTGAKLVIPCHPALRAELNAWPRQAVTILTDARGNCWRPAYLSERLPRALVKLGLPDDLNVHGLRKLAAANLADAGCTTHEIAAITGHRTLSMVQFYTQSADQERLAGAAIVRLSAAKDKRTKQSKKTGA